MSQGKAYPTELRARVLAAVLAGASITAAARTHGVDKRIVSKWVASDATLATLRQHEQDPAVLIAAIFELCLAHIDALRSQLATVSSVDYLKEQPAAGVAELLNSEASTLLRLLGGFRPREDSP